MYARSVFLVLSIAVASGCAIGEPVGELAGFELGEVDEQDDGSAAAEAMGQLFVEVADASGRPLRADSVWVAVDDGELRSARCMADDDGGCETWLAELEPGRWQRAASKVTVFAEVCDFLFLQSVSVPSEEAIEWLGLSTHLVVVADEAACEPDRAPRR
jgi:hypothetical protein